MPPLFKKEQNTTQYSSDSTVKQTSILLFGNFASVLEFLEAFCFIKSLNDVISSCLLFRPTAPEESFQLFFFFSQNNS